MAKTSKNVDVPNSKKYGIPLYGAAWVPPGAFRSKTDSSKSQDEDSTSLPPSASEKSHIVLAGGGGEGRSGIPNALLVSEFVFVSNSLSDQPVAKLGTGGDLPYRIAIHPGQDGVICSLPKSCSLTNRCQICPKFNSRNRVSERHEGNQRIYGNHKGFN